MEAVAILQSSHAGFASGESRCTRAARQTRSKGIADAIRRCRDSSIRSRSHFASGSLLMVGFAFLKGAAQLRLSTLVMLPGSARGNSHDPGRGVDGEIFVKYEMQDLPLACRKGIDCPFESTLSFVFLKRRIRRRGAGRRGCAETFRPQQKHPPNDLPAHFLGGSIADNGEEPGLEFRLSVEASFALQDVEVNGLEDILCVGDVSRTASQRPGEALGMQRLQPLLEIDWLHLEQAWAAWVHVISG